MGKHHRFGRSSLFLASHDTAHREHAHHHDLLRRQEKGKDPAGGVVGIVVTEVVATVSVYKQVTVDPNGSTVGLFTWTADATGGTLLPPSATGNATPTISASPPGSNSLRSTASSTAASGPADQTANNAAVSSSQSLLSIQDIKTASVATPSSIPTTFASTLANSTSLISVSSTTSLTPSFSKSPSLSSTISGSSSTPSSSVSLLSFSTISDDSSTSSTSSFSSTSSSSSTSSISSTSSFYSPSSASPTATATNGIIAGGGGTSTGSGDPSSKSPAAGGDDGSSAPSTSTVVGGVVGGVAAAAILIFLLMFLIRWKRRHSSMLALGNGEGEGAAHTTRSAPPSQPPGGMAQRSSVGVFAVPAALASLTGYKRSSQTTTDRHTISSTAGSERGFYRVSGRKLPSVFQNGGDGYGGGNNEPNAFSGSSFGQDSRSFYGGVGIPASPGLSTTRDSGVPIMREGPARTPITEPGPFADPPVSLTLPPRTDVVGRSHPSFDGSQRSRFTEEV
ncbi:hypothetical protein WAI453_005074 [Rhynchosporium graminicola]|uniref:Uncharacterized protein n=1 Tax=Rhynchosporium graminicola TaxID=2792576 RepID=A0A1E1L493_9HELO|nr:uncharacterized protein RCO7_08545 [Rhynchosporium commune]